VQRRNLLTPSTTSTLGDAIHKLQAVSEAEGSAQSRALDNVTLYKRLEP